MELIYDRSFPSWQKFNTLFSPCGKWFAVGGADAIVSIWDAYEYIPVRTISRLEWPVRTLSFSHNGKLLAAASEDHVIDISHVSSLQEIKWDGFSGLSFGLNSALGSRETASVRHDDDREDATHFTSRLFFKFH